MSKQTVEIQVQGMTCDDCRRHVQASLSAVDGISEVRIPDWRNGQVFLTVDTSVGNEILTETVQTAGYRGDVLNRRDITPKSTPASSKSPGDYDLIVIGTGAGGMAAAIRGAELGGRVAIVEGGTLGGTCVNIGCVPSKTLILAAAAFHTAGHSSFAGLQMSADSVDWKRLVSEKDILVSDLRQAKYADVLEAYADNITVFRGWASFTPEAHAVLDNGQRLRGANIVIATGARPATLSLQGSLDVPVLTSTSLMALDHQPKSLVIIGGRAVALELGQMLSRLGTQVTILQRSSTLIPDHEPEVAAGLIEALRAEGLEIHTQVTPVALQLADGFKEVVADVAGERRVVRAGAFLMAAGRRPNVELLNLDTLGVDVDTRGFIKVNAGQETTHSRIYAAGDVTKGPKLVYVAAAAGGIAAENALTQAGSTLDLRVLPEVIFTDPHVARVGLTERAAQAAGYATKTSLLPLSYVPRAIAARNTIGLIKLVADQATDKLLGAQILAAEGGEVIQSAALALRFGATVADLRASLFPYLTQVEGLTLTAQVFEKDVTRLSCCAG